MKQMIIINADDYGRSVAINEAIRSCFEDGFISDTSIMVTCKEGLEDLYNSRNLLCLRGSAGCHLTLTLGSSVTTMKRSLPFMRADGCFKDLSLWSVRPYYFTGAEKQIIYNEFMAQIDIVRSKLGLSISHLDSHQHIHMRLDLLPIVVKVCQDANIPCLRIPSRAKSLSLKSKVATWLKARYIRYHGIGIVDFFGSPGQIISSVKPSMSIIELMCHPMFNSQKQVINKVKENDPDDCEQLKEQLKSFSDYSLVNFEQVLNLLV